MRFRHQSGSFPLSGCDSLRRGLFLREVHPVGIDVVDGFHVTETNALRISVTEIALEILVVDDVKPHRSKGADGDTGTAADAFVVVHHYPAELLIPGDGLDGTDDFAGASWHCWQDVGI